jgi:hypothetical protein
MVSAVPLHARFGMPPRFPAAWTWGSKIVADEGGWPDVNGLPWEEIIRIRYEYEIDVLVATAVQRAVTPGLAREAAVSFAHATTAAAARVVRAGRTQGRHAGAEQVLGLARALDEFDDWRGAVPRRRPSKGRRLLVADPDPSPWVVADPDPNPWRNVGWAGAAAVIAAADRLISNVGSTELRQDLSAALDVALGSLADD